MLLGSLTVGVIGSWSGQAPLAASMGGLLGGILGYGSAAGSLSRITVSATLFAVLGVLIGPSCDDYGGHLAIPGAVLGAVLGWTFRRREQPRPRSDEQEFDQAAAS
jgi:hypothetical protein